MSMKSAFVNNKLDYHIYLNDELIEHIIVHPNMIQIPREGDELVLGNIDTDVLDVATSKTNVMKRDRHMIVESVTFVNAVVRTRKDAAVSTELMQQVHVKCRASGEPTLESAA